jgi:hypothetical protein
MLFRNSLNNQQIKGVIVESYGVILSNTNLQRFSAYLNHIVFISRKGAKAQRKKGKNKIVV